MVNKLKYWFLYTLLFVLFFQSTRALFVLYYLDEFKGVTGWSQKASIFFQGLKLDLSTTGYIMLIPGLVILVQGLIKFKSPKLLLRIYTQIILWIVAALAVADLFLFEHWGIRLDSTPFQYLTNFGEAANFVSLLQIIGNLLLVFILWLLFNKIYRLWLEPKLDTHEPVNFKQSILFLCLCALLVFPIRGGIGLTPLNFSHVFFSTNVFANQATINVPWNIIYSLSEMNKLQERYQYMPQAEAERKFQQFYPVDTTFTPILKTNRPNIILLILESFTAKLIDRKMDGKTITPNLNGLTREGIYFSNCYASGSRTDKGLVAILSGYPAMPKSAIINFQQKVRKLPSLVRDLNQVGYQSKFYYGGDINFANQKSYLLLNQMQQIIDKEDFPNSARNAKWGAHDHLVFDKLWSELPPTQAPYFYTLLSLSSHEPFEVPMETVFDKKDIDHQFANSAHYTDQALGNFVKQLKNSDHWDSTLLVIVADHGTGMLDKSQFFQAEKFKIPLLFLGGALAKDSLEIDTYVSQTDIAASILKQLEISTEGYLYSKDLFSPTALSFAYYSFNNGAGFVSENQISIFSNTNNKPLKRKGSNLMFPKSPEQVYLQILSKDYFEK